MPMKARTIAIVQSGIALRSRLRTIEPALLIYRAALATYIHGSLLFSSTHPCWSVSDLCAPEDACAPKQRERQRVGWSAVLWVARYLRRTQPDSSMDQTDGPYQTSSLPNSGETRGTCKSLSKQGRDVSCRRRAAPRRRPAPASPTPKPEAPPSVPGSSPSPPAPPPTGRAHLTLHLPQP